mmetsp:Transcript_4258/g.10944  ORF Transcript_4258/g.10944 Transcript_4258/m.10944 type:complete len:320 (-) Transcript_4258:187-1146(-)
MARASASLSKSAAGVGVRGLARPLGGQARAGRARAPMCRATADGKVPILVNSTAGKMGFATAESVVYAGLDLVPVSFASVAQKERVDVEGTPVEVFPVQERDAVIKDVLQQYPDLIVIDFTLPDAVNSNADFYIANKIPFVMGTTGGDRAKLLKDVEEAGLYSVIAANMGKQIVALQAMLQYAAREFPGAFAGYKLDVVESHQSTKVDTSGTAKDIVTSFNKLGMPCEEDDIRKVREPAQQMQEMNVPEEYLNGHAFHTYTLTSDDGSVNFQFQHNVCGRRFYAEGSVDAALFLHKQMADKSQRKLFDMVDVLNAGAMR